MKNSCVLITLMLSSVFAFAQWTWLSPIPPGNSLRSVYFTDLNTGYAVGNYGTILKTSDGGDSWTVLTSGTTHTLFSLTFTDNNTGYATGESGILLKTTDGGNLWTKLSTGMTKNLLSIYFPSKNTGFIVGQNGIILKTTDAGNT